MKLHFVPFGHVRALTDISTNEIFVNPSSLYDGGCEGDLLHETAHLISQDPDHGQRFLDTVVSIGGSLPVGEDVFKEYRKRAGIPSNICGNIGNVTGISNVLTDLHLLASYRKFSKKVLGTEGHWEVVGEVDGDASQQKIRLYPTPKGAYPVTVVYYPSVTHFRSPQAKMLANDMLLAESKCILGRALRKIAGMPSPDGGGIQYDGETLAAEGQKEKDEIIKKALSLGEPDRIFVW